MSLNPGQYNNISTLCVCVCVFHLNCLSSEATRHFKGHLDGTAVLRDRSGQVADFNWNVRSRGAVMVTNRNLRHKIQPM